MQSLPAVKTEVNFLSAVPVFCIDGIMVIEVFIGSLRHAAVNKNEWPIHQTTKIILTGLCPIGVKPLNVHDLV